MMRYCNQCGYCLKELSSSSTCPECGNQYDLNTGIGTSKKPKKYNLRRRIKSVLSIYILASYVTALVLSLYSEVYIYHSKWTPSELSLYFQMNGFRIALSPLWMFFYVALSSLAWLVGWNNTTMQWEHFGTGRPLFTFVISVIVCVSVMIRWGRKETMKAGPPGGR